MSFLGTFCATMIALLFGLFLVFGGYRFFLLLLPIWGFFFGFALGAGAIVAIFPADAFLATVTSWVVGFILAVVFAVLSYLFYFIAVGVVAASLGYALGIGFMGLFGIPLNFLSWIVGVVVAVALVVVTYRFNLQKYVIIAATTMLGAGIIVATFLLGVDSFVVGGQEITLGTLADPVRLLWSSGHWFYSLIWIALVVAGFVLQLRINNNYTVEEYNRWEEYPA